MCYSFLLKREKKKNLDQTCACLIFYFFYRLSLGIQVLFVKDFDLLKKKINSLKLKLKLNDLKYIQNIILLLIVNFLLVFHDFFSLILFPDFPPRIFEKQIQKSSLQQCMSGILFLIYFFNMHVLKLLKHFFN